MAQLLQGSLKKIILCETTEDYDSIETKEEAIYFIMAGSKKGIQYKGIEFLNVDLDTSTFVTESGLTTTLADYLKSATAETLYASLDSLSAKQDALTTAQLAAVNSGVTSDTVAQVATNTTDIASLSTNKVGTLILDFGSGTTATISDLPTVNNSCNCIINKYTTEGYTLYGTLFRTSSTQLDFIGSRLNIFTEDKICNKQQVYIIFSVTDDTTVQLVKTYSITPAYRHYIRVTATQTTTSDSTITRTLYLTGTFVDNDSTAITNMSTLKTRVGTDDTTGYILMTFNSAIMDNVGNTVYTPLTNVGNSVAYYAFSYDSGVLTRTSGTITVNTATVTDIVTEIDYE